MERETVSVLEVGSKAPDFTLEDQNGQPVHLRIASAGRDRPLLYPKDNSAAALPKPAPSATATRIFRMPART